MIPGIAKGKHYGLGRESLTGIKTRRNKNVSEAQGIVNLCMVSCMEEDCS